MLSLLLLSGLSLAGAGAAVPADGPQIVSVRRIWDLAPHNAFTDLVRFRDTWFCAFREGSGHIPGTDGRLRVLSSGDGETWQSAALLEEPGIDLRDAKLSVTPDARLMLLCDGSVYAADAASKSSTKRLVTFQSRVFFSPDGRRWTAPQPVAAKDEWLWRVTWHKGKAYGVAYGKGEAKDWPAQLYAGSDGVHFERVARLAVPGRPNETTLRFLADDRMLALVRREAGNGHAWIGVSPPPYTQWNWQDAGYGVGGPDFIVLPGGAMWAAGRLSLCDDKSHKDYRTVLARFGLTSYQPVLTLPSGGDTSYPGLVWHEGLLWMSYYSSHEGKPSIYLAKIRLP